MRMKLRTSGWDIDAFLAAAVELLHNYGQQLFMFASATAVEYFSLFTPKRSARSSSYFLVVGSQGGMRVFVRLCSGAHGRGGSYFTSILMSRLVRCICT